MKYYISRSGQQYGPYSLEDLQSMKAQGRIDANDLAWGEGMASWVAVSQILDSGSTAAATPPAYTPPQPQQQQYTPPQQQYTPPQQQYTPPQQQYTPPQQQYTPPQQQYTPPQQQYTPQAAQYGAAPAPAYSAPAYNAGYSGQPMAGGPMPPAMSWALVLVLGVVVPFFALVWIFVELGFVKKIDPASKAGKQFVTSILALIGGLILGFGIIAGAGAADKPAIAALGGFIIFAAYIITIVFGILAMFSMRSSIQNYYNTVEPIGLRLSGVMTFFFNIYYFQYHFNRITNWKQTGRLV